MSVFSSDSTAFKRFLCTYCILIYDIYYPINSILQAVYEQAIIFVIIIRVIVLEGYGAKRRGDPVSLEP